MARCSSCGAEIIFAKTAAGKPAPFNAATVKVTVLTRDLLDEELVVAGEAEGHVSHFATCPSAAAHRKPRCG